jgi:hypothetical protein
MAQTFQDHITKERERLHAERDAIAAQQKELEQKLAGINRELRAVEAYEAAKAGKAAPRATGSRRAPQARKGSKRDGILKVIKENPAGLSRGDLLEKMGLKGNKSGEMSVSNALTALTKGNQVARKDGKYVAA